ncbi:glycine cleavage system protein R [Denitratisoma oestradiolicum]|uniref:Glycine cleavage system protein R n=1 Tax=Denitratisoma oestradiolicum TaxID=311182 RepID=A0A6S6Y0H0_9PROT|nr:ACT domain-containing protein [Denitratisoma oestradiolicum]TWO80176.1 glycine cleavage system protein R [Denitratisoma oestradiolicum]CAB1369975.1 Glycine cleavage system protein R [Denitratisoma oestradiolicum]
MSVYLVLTVIGNDRPGLVGELSAVISQHQGNWLESSMSRLAGKFAGIVKVSVPEAHARPLQQALEDLSDLKVTLESSAIGSESRGGRRLHLSLVGHDRIGIVREVSQVLARHAINVEALETHTSSAPMSAETLFHAEAELLADASLDTRTLTLELENISNDLMVDISLDEKIS